MTVKKVDSPPAASSTCIGLFLRYFSSHFSTSRCYALDGDSGETAVLGSNRICVKTTGTDLYPYSIVVIVR